MFCVDTNTESDNESESSNSSEETVTESSYKKELTNRRIKDIEQINEDIGRIHDDLEDLDKVSELIKKLLGDKKQNNENLEEYKDDYPDYFNKKDGSSVEESLEHIKDEKTEEIKHKQQQVDSIMEQINKKAEPMEGTANDNSNLLENITNILDDIS